ncbi:MAG: ATP-binding cassette domain-containing protein, partial [Bradyrhizobiaceae bacterium]|nr:ATP-binding cassette domain-containing protein [Bradyrhizobiaceae bacterium]
MNSDRATATLAPEAGLSAQVPRLNKRPHVTVRGLSKRFNDAVIYDRFDLDIPRGQLVAIFGPNGCGKSTLINMIAGLIPVDAGEILFDGQTV